MAALFHSRLRLKKGTVNNVIEIPEDVEKDTTVKNDEPNRAFFFLSVLKKGAKKEEYSK